MPRSWNVINAGDTSDPRYASAYYRLFQTQKPHYIQTETGEKVVWETQAPPDWVATPGAGGAGTTAPITYNEPPGTVPATGDPNAAASAVTSSPAVTAAVSGQGGGTVISEPQDIPAPNPSRSSR